MLLNFLSFLQQRSDVGGGKEKKREESTCSNCFKRLPWEINERGKRAMGML
jgi:hypothetical protein